MKIIPWLLIGLLSTTASADTLKLRDGTTLDGKIISMNDQGVRFETAGGEVRFLKDSEILSMQKSPAAAAASAAAPVPAASSTATTGSVTIPKGTTLTVKFDEDVTSKQAPGTRFTTTLETNVLVGNQVAVPAGTKVYGVIADAKQQGLVGQSAIALTLTGFNLAGNVVPIKTEVLAGSGDRKARQGARGAAAGAAIGAAAGGGGGAAKGAMIGAAASTLRRQKVGVPADALQDFRLAEAVTLHP